MESRLSFACVLLMSCLVFPLAIGGDSLTDDESALLAFKAQITSDPQNVLASSWSTNISFCNWIGVTCSAAGQQRVTALSLSSMQLQGTIPPQVGNLSFLKSINLSNNSFLGYLPQELAQLRRLKYLNLAYNKFAGEIPFSSEMLPQLHHLLLNNNSLTGIIPPSLFNVTTLETLILDSNLLQGNISEEIGNLTKLKILSMGYNQLSGDIPPTLFNPSSLQIVNLQVNSLSGSLPVDICKKASNLTVVDLASNQLHGQIPLYLQQCTELQVLNLDNNQFTGIIPKAIGGLRKLKEINLGRNNFTGNIPKEIGSCTVLTKIDMGTNNLTGPIPQEMSNLHNLQELNLAFNNINESIPSTFFNFSMLRIANLAFNHLSGHLPADTGRRLPNLEKLYLEENGFSGVIPESISNASRLIILDVSSNSFSGSIPNWFGRLRNLQRLNLADNLLTNEDSSSELSFLTSLSTCRNLTYLRFNGNPLVGSLPSSIGNLTSLEELYAFDCTFNGTIPREIGNLTNLIGLILQNNALTGTIPREIGRLRYLQDFSLGTNSLHGSIPEELCLLSRVSYLFLRENQLSGPLPACMGNLTSLKEIYFGSNRFTSPLPPSLWSLQNMLILNLSMNSLTGPLPSEIGNLKVLTLVDLSRNQLSGELPTSFGELKSLSNLSLSGNKFQGSIPESFGNMLNLESLDLSSNNLSGVIPKSLEKLIHLADFNLSFNGLQGEIPDGGPFQNFSARSFLENGALCGPARLQVPPCKSSSHHQSKKSSVAVLRYSLPVVTFILLVLASISIFLRCRRTNLRVAREESENSPPPSAWRRISYYEIEQATDGFSEVNFLGTGAFGSVYRGTLSDGMIVAVKVFNLQVEGSFMSFDAECELLRSLRHRNLVKIISSCCREDFKALILEFMPRCSLDKWLYSHNYFLNIFQRLNILIDVASALEYLHHGYITPVVHCDLKPSNILLDDDMVARVGDFGIAKLLGEEDSITRTITLATIGYMAPEYGSEGIVSVRGDVYSYGILMMEIITRKKPTDEMFAEGKSLKQWIKQSLPESVSQIVDANLLRNDEECFEAKKDCLTSMLKLAVECSADIPEERLYMKDVLAALKKVKQKFHKSVGWRDSV